MTTLIYLANLTAILNSLAIVTLIVNQNESSNNILLNKNLDQNKGNPLENLTWLLLFTQFCFILVQIKVSTF